ncbi:MAG: rhomboid family intramembrane serine protease [Bacteroidetes bacterium]|nr:MAG: rhomboid family intramembrane serine protease [Bacteroidota bacterium]
MIGLDLSVAPATFILLLLNVLISGYALFGDGSLVERMAFRPRRILDQKEYYRLITAGFVHVSLAHLAFNMITLYFFGPLLEMRLGTLRFLVLFFGAELAAHGLSLWMHRDNLSYAAVGASGAVSGVVFAFCLYRPFAKLYVFFAIPITAIVFALLYVVGSIYAMRRAQAEGVQGGIAHEAHLGGAVGGLLLTILLDPQAIAIFLAHFGL